MTTKTPRYRLTDRGTLPAGNVRVTTIPRRIAARSWVAKLLATQPQGRGVSNTVGFCESDVPMYLFDERLAGVPCNAIRTA
jgi:hypothetical protein